MHVAAADSLSDLLRRTLGGCSSAVMTHQRDSAPARGPWPVPLREVRTSCGKRALLFDGGVGQGSVETPKFVNLAASWARSGAGLPIIGWNIATTSTGSSACIELYFAHPEDLYPRFGPLVQLDSFSALAAEQKQALVRKAMSAVYSHPDPRPENVIWCQPSDSWHGAQALPHFKLINPNTLAHYSQSSANAARLHWVEILHSSLGCKRPVGAPPLAEAGCNFALPHTAEFLASIHAQLAARAAPLHQLIPVSTSSLYEGIFLVTFQERGPYVVRKAKSFKPQSVIALRNELAMSAISELYEAQLSVDNRLYAAGDELWLVSAPAVGRNLRYYPASTHSADTLQQLAARGALSYEALHSAQAVAYLAGWRGYFHDLFLHRRRLKISDSSESFSLRTTEHTADYRRPFGLQAFPTRYDPQLREKIAKIPWEAFVAALHGLLHGDELGALRLRWEALRRHCGSCPK